MHFKCYMVKNMPEVAKIVPRIKFNVKPRYRNLKNKEGPEGRINIIRTIMTALLKHERIEMHLPKCDEVRGYAERLISEAVRHGDKHPPTMEMANFWLQDKQVLHKLFKVLAPRYKDSTSSATTMHLIPIRCRDAYEKKSCAFYPLCVLELKGNPYPPMPQKPKPNSASLTNILLREASKDFRKMKLNESIGKTNQS